MASIEEQLPAFHYFHVGNGYTGNIGNRRYKIITDRNEKKLTAHVYDGPLCYELTKARDGILFTGEFELTEEGFDQCRKWLEEKMRETSRNE